MKRLIIFLLIMGSIALYSDEIDISKIEFTGVNVSNSLKVNKDVIDRSVYNVCYSAILPADGIYSLKDKTTGKETVVQIGAQTINQSPYILYLSDDLFKYFKGEDKRDKISLTVKFIGWNKPDESSQFLDIQSLIIEPENAYKEINKNGKDKFYIQLGSFSYYQNAYPGIAELLPYLQIKPNFYLIKKEVILDGELKSVYNVVAGPYTKKDASLISNSLNSKNDKKVLLRSSDTIIKEGKSNKK